MKETDTITDYTLFTPGCYLPTLMTLAVVVYRQCHKWLVMTVLYLQVDILHPLATLQWEEGPNLPVKICTTSYVFVNDRFYVRSGPPEVICVFSTNLDLLSILFTPTLQCGLTTYNSQLVLVGGSMSNKPSNQLWVSNERKGIWDPSLLPPMPTARSYLSAVNTGSTDCIVVAGGVGETGALDVVEVLIQGQWWTLQPLPEPCWNMISTLHNGKWYLISWSKLLYCNLESLLMNYEQSSDVWSKIDDNFSYVGIVSFGQQLVAIGRGGPTIHAFSPLTQSWVHVGDMPEVLAYSSTIVLPTRELVVIEEELGENESSSVFKASLTSEELILQHFLFARRIMCCSLTKAFSTFHYPC